MLRLSCGRWAPRTLPYMFRKLKLAGAHPDILWSVDPQKAQHNGEEMVRLESLFHDRERRLRRYSGAGGAANTNAADASLREPQSFLLWIKNSSSSSPSSSASRGGGGATSGGSDDGSSGGGGRVVAASMPGTGDNSSSNSILRAARCTLTPAAPAHVLKAQLSELFAQAGVLEDFYLDDNSGGGGGGAPLGLESVLRDAGNKMESHLSQSGDLYRRADRAVDYLRQYGVLLAVADDAHTYLASLPDAEPLSPSEAPRSRATNNSSGNSGGNSPQAALPGSGLYTAAGELTADAHDFMAERGLRVFDLRMAGGHASVERFVGAMEELEGLYRRHRGRALRTSVCLVISLAAPAGGRDDNHVAPDGCIVLSLARQPAWETFLLGLPAAVWDDCVRLHGEWRLGHAPALKERRRQLARVADAFHVWRVFMDGGGMGGGGTDWQAPLLARLLKDEAVIRRTIAKYNIRSDYLKKKGCIYMVRTLRSSAAAAHYDKQRQNNNNNSNNASRTQQAGATAAAPAPGEIGYRIGGDGTVTFSAAVMNTGQMLRVLKDNLARIERSAKRHETAVTALERLSRRVPVDFSVDTEWRAREEEHFMPALEAFVRTMQDNEAPLAAFLAGMDTTHSSSNNNNSGGRAAVARGSGAAPASTLKRMVWVVSDRYDILPSGVVFIPYNVDFASIKRILLSR